MENADSPRTWWQDHDRLLRTLGDDADEPLLSPELVDLLSAVEAEFAQLDGPAQAWEAPNLLPGGEQRDPYDDEPLPVVSVGVGSPTVPVLTLPVCGCDACDDGSAELIQQLDELAVAVVDGSLEVSRGGGDDALRTSFTARSGWSADGNHPAARVVASPWVEGRAPRPLWPWPEEE